MCVCVCICSMRNTSYERYRCHFWQQILHPFRAFRDVSNKNFLSRETEDTGMEKQAGNQQVCVCVWFSVYVYILVCVCLHAYLN